MKKFYVLLLLVINNFLIYGQICPVILNYQNACDSLCNGKININPSQPGVHHLFLNGVFEQSFSSIISVTNLCPGTYQIFITDSVTCNFEDTIIMQQSGPISFSLTVQNASCPSCNDGMISAPIGFAHYNWSTGTITQSNVVPPGYYCVTVTDLLGCTASQCDTVGYYTGISLIKGQVYIDADSNGVRNNFEPLINNIQITANPGGYTANTWSYFPYSSPNNFTIGVLNGNYTISPVLPSNWQQTSLPLSYNVTVFDTLVSGYSFGVIPDTFIVSVFPYIHYGHFRCNQPSSYYFTYYNQSLLVEKGEIYFSLDPQLNFISSNPVPQNIIGNTYYWTFDTLLPFHYKSIKIDLITPGAGSIVTSSAIINLLDPSSNIIFSDTVTTTKTVSCAWDPNDKLALPEGIGTQNIVPLNTPELDFTIRFQNTGTDTAFVVILVDTLSSLLDLSTFEILAASHEMYTQMDPGGILTFTFDNILLPDSNVNEPASHGFVRYRIKPISPVTDPTVITNTAHIIFDQNPAIVTNTTLTTFSDNLLSVAEIKGGGIIKAYPNPFSNEVLIQFEKNISAKAELYDYLGRVIKNYAIFNTSSFVIARNDLKSGLYLLKITTEDNSTTLKLMVK